MHHGVRRTGDKEPPHVLIKYDIPSQLENAVQTLSTLMQPVEEGKNLHKRQQLRELAEINGN
jgi:hypothetical protein